MSDLGNYMAALATRSRNRAACMERASKCWRGGAV
jgi:hypothetical protein